jgi:hypothetical protein
MKWSVYTLPPAELKRIAGPFDYQADACDAQYKYYQEHPDERTCVTQDKEEIHGQASS